MPRPVVACLLLLSASPSGAQRGSAFRCRDRDAQCSEWAGRGECDSNPHFMGETCPGACEMCANAGLLPTPAVFQLDFVCKGRLATRPSGLKGERLSPSDYPDECMFRCRDNMTTSVCAHAVADGACTKPETARAARFQCAQSCGVCKGLDLVEPPTAKSYPKHLCRATEGDAPSHAEQCKAWAEAGECVRNFGFMSASCEHSCGLCSVATDGGTAVAPYLDVLKPPAMKRPKSKRSAKPKKVAGGGAKSSGMAAAVAAETVKVEVSPTAETVQAEGKQEAAVPETAAKQAAEAAEAATPTTEAAAEGKPKKKGWVSGIKDAVGSAIKGKKEKAAPKDET